MQRTEKLTCLHLTSCQSVLLEHFRYHNSSTYLSIIIYVNSSMQPGSLSSLTGNLCAECPDVCLYGT